MVPASPADRFDRTLLVAILLLAVALRLAAAFLLPDQHFPDAIGYRQAGRDLWSSGMLGTSIWMPLYPALIGLTGPGWGQLALDIALSTSAVWLIYRLVLVVFTDQAAALLAAFMMAIYPYFIFYAVVGLTESLFIAAAGRILVLVSRLVRHRGCPHRALNSHTAIDRAVGSVSHLIFCGGHSSNADRDGCPPPPGLFDHLCRAHVALVDAQLSRLR
jgi:hypothetical protein